MSEYIRCNLCGADDTVVRYPSTIGNGQGPDDWRAYACTHNGYGRHHTITQCRHCGLVYANPRPGRGEISGTYQAVRDPLYVRERQGRVLTFRHHLEPLERVAAAPAGRPLLDVGCYTGVFVEIATDHGWDAWGVEPSRWAVERARARGLHVVQGMLESACLPEGYFSVVTMWDVIEHLTDPRGGLKRAWQLLRPGGLLVVHTIDIESRFARLMGRRWPWLMEMHLYYFSQRTLGRMLETSGFEVMQSEAQGRYLGLGYLANRVGALAPAVGRLAEWLVTRLGLQGQRVPLNLGDLFTVYARKVGDCEVESPPSARRPLHGTGAVPQNGDKVGMGLARDLRGDAGTPEPISPNVWPPESGTEAVPGNSDGARAGLARRLQGGAAVHEQSSSDAPHAGGRIQPSDRVRADLGQHWRGGGAARKILGLALLLSLLVLLAVLAQRVLPPSVGTSDFIGYWAGARLVLGGQDPYDGEKVLAVQREAYPDRVEAMYTWNPPWLGAILVPLGALPFRAATTAWLLINLLVVGASGLALWRLFGGPSGGRWAALALAIVFFFPQTLVALDTGQVSTLVLAGVAGFLACFRAERWLPAGAFLALTTIKPHLVFLWLPLVMLWTVVGRRWGVWIGFGLALGVWLAILTVLLPTWPGAYSAVLQAPPTQWATPTAGGLAAVLGGPGWGRYLGLALVPAVVLLWWRMRCVRLAVVTAGLLPLSLATAVFGWSYDQILLLVPVVAMASALARGRLPRWAGWLVTGLLGAVGAGLVAQRLWFTAEVYYFWVPWAVMGVGGCFVWFTRVKRRGAEAQRRGGGARGGSPGLKAMG